MHSAEREPPTNEKNQLKTASKDSRKCMLTFCANPTFLSMHINSTIMADIHINGRRRFEARMCNAWQQCNIRGGNREGPVTSTSRQLAADHGYDKTMSSSAAFTGSRLEHAVLPRIVCKSTERKPISLMNVAGSSSCTQQQRYVASRYSLWNKFTIGGTRSARIRLVYL